MSPSSHLSQPIALPPTPLTATSLPQQPVCGHSSLHSAKSWWHQIVERFQDLRLWIIELYQNNVGLLLIAASQLFMTFMNIAVKFLNDLDNPVPTLELVFVRMVNIHAFSPITVYLILLPPDGEQFITYCCSVSYMIVRKIPHAIVGPPEVRSLLVFRGVSGFFGLLGIYYSLKFLSLSDAVVLTFLSPTTTAVAGFLFLHETLSRREVFAGLLSLFGVVLIARPQSLFGTNTQDVFPEGVSEVGDAVNSITSTQRLVAVGVAMIGVAGATGAYISLRAIGTRAHTMHSLTFFSSYSVIVSILGMVIFRVPPVIPKKWSWCGLLAAVGICGFIAQILLVKGLQRETASRGTLALYVQIIFATVLERLIFNVVPSYLSVIGTIIIMSSAIYVAINKDTKPGAYKRIPQRVEDLEAHELVDTPETPIIEEIQADATQSKLPPLHGEAHSDK